MIAASGTLEDGAIAEIRLSMIALIWRSSSSELRCLMVSPAGKRLSADDSWLKYILSSQFPSGMVGSSGRSCCISGVGFWPDGAGWLLSNVGGWLCSNACSD
jgi:hypothetical protein